VCVCACAYAHLLFIFLAVCECVCACDMFVCVSNNKSMKGPDQYLRRNRCPGL